MSIIFYLILIAGACISCLIAILFGPMKSMHNGDNTATPDIVENKYGDYCDDCGATIDRKHRFCPNCGKNVR